MAQTPEEAAMAVAEATGYVQPQLTAEQQAIQGLYSQPLPIGTSQQTPEQATVAVYKQDQINQSLTQQDDGVAAPSVNPGVGAGTSNNAYDTRGNDDNPGVSSNTTQQTLSQTFAGQQIVSQPNVLDRYASYTYGISWYILTPEQYNQLSTPNFNTGSWSLLMQSGGAPVASRNQYFPNDYYLDDLEIETFLMGKGTNMSTNAMEIKFKVVEPNGITLIQNLYKAVVAAYKNSSASNISAATTRAGTVSASGTAAAANQTNLTPNYGAAQYCLTIEFYGYDSNGKLVAPATGQYTSNGQLSNTNPQTVIKKYYPFIIQNITFRTVANAIEYNVVASAIPYATAGSQSRGTIPFGFQLSGQTVAQILQGGPRTASTAAADPGARNDKPSPAQVDSPDTAALFNDGTGYAPGYDPNAGWSA
jgi:hypothetical protein